MRTAPINFAVAVSALTAKSLEFKVQLQFKNKLQHGYDNYLQAIYVAI